MQNTEIYLVRHGQTEWNLQGRWQGQMDSNLTPLGVAQAKAVGRRLEHIQFDALYSSDLGRTVNTAKEIAAVTGHEIITDERLRERRGGIMEGRTLEEAKAEFPEHFEVHLDNRSPNFAFPGGESEIEMRNRAIDGITELAQRHAGERIVAVSHGAILSSFMRHLLGMDPIQWRFRMNNCGLSIITYGDFYHGEWIVNTLNEFGHLDGIVSAMGEAE